MVDAQLTPMNFIQLIKEMQPADRKKITLKKLIEVIIETPEPDERAKFVDLQLAQLTNAMKNITDLANQNRAEITNLRRENAELTTAKNDMARELNTLKAGFSTGSRPIGGDFLKIVPPSRGGRFRGGQQEVGGDNKRKSK